MGRAAPASPPRADHNTLYVNTGLLDFGNIGLSAFKYGLDQPTPVNLNTAGNFFASPFNETLRGTVYALGRVNLTLMDYSGSVKVFNDEATQYDWNKGGTMMRSMLIDFERWRTGLDDRHGFNVYYYGTGRLNVPMQPSLNVSSSSFFGVP